MDELIEMLKAVLAAVILLASYLFMFWGLPLMNGTHDYLKVVICLHLVVLGFVAMVVVVVWAVSTLKDRLS